MAHDTEKLRGLLERVESGFCGWAVDVAIAHEFFDHAAVTKDQRSVVLPAYSTSLDASVALVGRLLPRWSMSLEIAPRGHAGCDLSGPEFCDADMSQWASSKVLPTPLAILSALLRALISQAEGEGIATRPNTQTEQERP